MKELDRNQLAATFIFGISLAACIAAFLWGLAQLLPAISAAHGIFISAATTGFATAGAISSWIPTAAALGIAGSGISVTYYALSKTIIVMSRKPYELVLPSLAILAMFLVDMTKDIAFTTQLERATLALLTGAMTIAGGFLITKKTILVRAIGILLPFFPPTIVTFSVIANHGSQKIIDDIISAGSLGAAGLIGALISALIVVLLGVTLGRSS